MKKLFLVTFFIMPMSMNSFVESSELPNTYESEFDETALVNMIDKAIEYLVTGTENPMMNPVARRDMAQMIVAASKANNVPAFLITSMVYLESSFKPNAIGKLGEKGLLQCHGVAARGCDLKTPIGQLDCGARWLRSRIDLACDLTLFGGLTAYTSGQCEKVRGNVVETRLFYFERLRQRFYDPASINAGDSVHVEIAADPVKSEPAVQTQAVQRIDILALVAAAKQAYLDACATVSCPVQTRCVPINGVGVCQSW